MDDFGANFWTLPPPFNMVVMLVVLVVTIPTLGGVVTRLITNIRIFVDHRADRQFKLELIENGLEAEEAERWASMSMRPSRRETTPG